jgi:concanavalin A-like lectin/glucanase superfamily protein
MPIMLLAVTQKVIANSIFQKRIRATMKITIKLLVLLFTTVFALELCAENKPVLDLNFKSYLPAGTEITGGKIVKIQESDALILDKKRKSNFLDFNGRNDTLQINLSQEAQKTLEGSFTLEFDFLSSKLPKDKDYHNPGLYNIGIFSALDKKNKLVLNFYINRFNRITVSCLNKKGKNSTIQSTWNHKNNHELTNIQHGKWYQVALVYNQPENLFELYLDGEKLGKTKTAGNLKIIECFRFGDNSKGNRKRLFRGGIDNIKISSGILHDEKSNIAAQKKSWQRLHDTANQDIMKSLSPEKPEWSEYHPKMLLTPARIEVMKANLKKGRGPELVKRLIARCDAMINPESPDYLKEFIAGHSISRVMKPVELCLATILTGKKKYASYAAKIVTDYTEKFGYYDMTHQLVMSAGQAKPMMSITLTYDWGYQYFTPEQRKKMRLFLLNIAKGTYVYYNGDPAFQAKKDALSGWVANWAALSTSTLGNASLAIMGETSAPVKLWLDYAAFRAAQYGLFATGMDGCFHEMPGYLAYGAGPIVMFMEALHTAGGDDLIMATNFSKFPNCLPYLIYPNSRKIMTLKYSAPMNGLHAGDSYIMALLRQKLKTQQMEWDWQHLYENTVWAQSWSLFPLIWFEPEKKKVTSPDLPLAKWFKSEGVMAFRSDWTKDALAGTFMAYPARMVAHDQCDRGQFTLYGYQGRWIVDNGGRQLPQHAWRDAHNLITVDNKVPRQKARLMKNYHHDAFMTGFCTADSIMTAAEADLTQSYRYTYTWGHQKRANVGKYEDPFKNANRKILYMREKTAPPYLLVYDSIQENEKEHIYTLNLHTASENEVKVDKNHVEFHQYPVRSDKLSYVSRPVNKDGSRRYYYSGDPDAGYAEYTIKIPIAGEYDLYGFGRPGNKVPGGMDSFFIKFGGEKIAWGTNGNPTYRWSKINTTPYKLKAGEEVLTVLMREPEARVAKFALFPVNAGIPLFNKSDNPKLIIIDAGKPDKIVKDFIVGTEKVALNTAEAKMTLLQLAPRTGFKSKVFPGSVLPHQRLQCSAKAVCGKFLNFYYPRKPGMEQPELSEISKSISLLKWENCTDLICINSKKEINAKGIKSDADLVVVRKQGDSIISFVMMNGTFLAFNDKELIRLAGGKGIAGWTADTLTVNGENVFDFTFNFPAENKGILNLFSSSKSLKNVTADGKNIKVAKKGKGWSAESPFAGNEVLTW